ncbi:hypothetical protein J6590_014412 [Homalodisca vitripennis]|nr:hypothetical protein J6590_014412 [Homalodisca vitripennis]
MDQAFFQQYDASPHFTNPVKRFLNDNLHGRWIGRRSDFLGNKEPTRPLFRHPLVSSRESRPMNPAKIPGRQARCGVIIHITAATRNYAWTCWRCADWLARAVCDRLENLGDLRWHTL